MVLLATAQTEETFTDDREGYIQLVMGPSAEKITGYLHGGEIAAEIGRAALDAGAAGYEGLKYIAINDCIHVL